MAVVCTAGIAALVFAASMATTPVLLAVALFGGGACDAVTDVAQNTHGLRVQRVYGRSIINSLHAIWSLGAVIGAGMAAAAIALHVPRAMHLGVVGLLFAGVAVAAYPFLLRGPDVSEHEAAESARNGGAGWRIYGALAALVIIAIAGAAVEDAGSSWATLYLRDGLGAAGAVAALGYVALLGFQFVGRLIGDRLVDRFGERAVARVGGLITAAGMGTGTGGPERAGHHRGLRCGGHRRRDGGACGHARRGSPAGSSPGSGLTVVAWLMRVGFVAAPPIVGMVADATSLRVGLLVVPLAGPRGSRLGRRAQCTTRANSIVSTPATMSAMPAIIFHVSGSLKRYRAITATIATPHAVQTP